MDEKKIEEAKKAFIADKKILGIEAMNDLACGFKAGAHWAIHIRWPYIDDILPKQKGGSE